MEAAEARDQVVESVLVAHGPGLSHAASSGRDLAGVPLAGATDGVGSWF
jgi:hypothetical protein